MKYEAELPDESLSDLTIIDETGGLVGYLRFFDSVLFAIDLMAMINGSKLPVVHFPKGELEAVADVENDDDHQWWVVMIYADETRICAVEGLDYGDALKLGEALVKQVKENQEPEPSTKDSGIGSA